MNCDITLETSRQCQSVQGFKFYRRSKFQFPIGNWWCRYNSAQPVISLCCASTGYSRCKKAN